jgi:uridylate kinase
MTADDLKYRRVVLKLSGEALAGEQGFGISPKVVDRLTDELQSLHELGADIGLVIGGGNIVRGTTASQEGMDRVSADYMGMLATIINALALQDLLERKGVETRVMTAIRMEALAEPYIRRRALRHLEKRRVVIFAGWHGQPVLLDGHGGRAARHRDPCQPAHQGDEGRGHLHGGPGEGPGRRVHPAPDLPGRADADLRVMDAAAVSLCRENDLPIIVLNIQSAARSRRRCGARSGARWYRNERVAYLPGFADAGPLGRCRALHC